MAEITQNASVQRNWLPALSPVWDSGAEPLLLPANRRLLFGSDPSCDLCVTIPGVANRHCILEFRNNAVVIHETHAPVWVNDVPARAGSRIRPGNQIALGSATFRVEKMEIESRPPNSAFNTPDWYPAVFSTTTTAETDGVLPEQLNAWQNSLQERSNELSRQSQDLEQRFSQILRAQSDCEVRARELDETQAAIRSDRLAIETERAELEAERHRFGALQSEFTEYERHDQHRLSDAAKRSEDLDAQAQLLAENTAALHSQTQVFNEERAAFDEIVAAHHLKVEEDLARIAAQTTALHEQQRELEQHAHEAEQMLTARQQDLQDQQKDWNEREECVSTMQQELSTREHQLNERDQELQRSVDAYEQSLLELDQRDQLVRSEEDERVAREESLQRQRHDLEEQASKLDERANAIASHESAVADREQQAMDRESLLEQRETALAEASHAASEQHAEHQTRMNELERWAEELMERQNGLDEQAKDLEVCRVQLDSELADSTDVQAERDRLQQLQQELDQKLETLQTESSDLERRESDFSLKAKEQEQQLSELAARQTEMMASLSLRDNELQEAEQRLAAAQSAVDTKLADLAEDADHQLRTDTQLAQLQTLLNDTTASKDDLKVQVTSLQSERDELAAALQEMQFSVEALRSQVSEESDQDEIADLKAHAESLQTELNGRNEVIEQQGERLQELESETARRDQQIEELQAQLETEATDLQSRFDALKTASIESSEQETALLRQIEQLQDEVKSASNPNPDMQAQFQEQQALILQLTEQLQLAETALNSSQERGAIESSPDEDLVQQLQDQEVQLAELRRQLQEALEHRESGAVNSNTVESDWQQQIDDRDVLIRDLQERLATSQNEATSALENVTDEEIAMRSRELDDRTVLLDRRDDELGEWNRRLQNTEEDLESERRQLQEARQQLELARAELQVSIEQPMPLDPDPMDETPTEVDFTETEPQPVEVEKTESVSHIRSELASLFGMSDELEVSEELPVDVGTEGGDSVVMSFEETQGVLLEAQEPVSEDTTESEDSDYVTKYMEQLLSRSRGAAGESLPQELDRSSLSKESPSEDTQKPKTTSFIDQYMQDHGEFGESVHSGDADASCDTPAPPLPERSKIDVEALRKDMNSFREVSVMSAQKALESHAMKKEQGGLAGRQAVLVALVIVTLFVGAAQFMEIIDFPLAVWGLAIGTVGAGIELYRCHRALRDKVQELTRATGPDEEGEHEVDYDVTAPSEILPDKFNKTVVFGPMPEKENPELPIVKSQQVEEIVPSTESEDIAAVADAEADSSLDPQDAIEAEVSPLGVVSEPEEEKYYEV